MINREHYKVATVVVADIMILGSIFLPWGRTPFTTLRGLDYLGGTFATYYTALGIVIIVAAALCSMALLFVFKKAQFRFGCFADRMAGGAVIIVSVFLGELRSIGFATAVLGGSMLFLNSFLKANICRSNHKR